ncbi:sigma-70 family RNA polymerase sigma factor [Pirellulimonas nuda]|uniref:sigma-70 family RNA polymerase sigma factor n=1 Tax=Pirellulimonas nuda TaxID=2528009 RepID=UPI001E567864|nr:sigma-70 family RNA polymerase sigma factor [Pirellulimonas nuda]
MSVSGPPDLASRDPATADAEARWLRAARGGDRDAFGRLAEKHQQRLFHCLLRLCGSADDAEELAQDALVQAYVKLDSFQENSAFFTWLYRIAFNLAASRARRRRPRASLNAAVEAGVPEPTAPAAPPDGPMIQQERDSLVQHAIGRLAQEHRQVIVLREIEGLDYQQIADVLETPVGTVRSRLFRARMQLRELLAPMFAEETSA